VDDQRFFDVVVGRAHPDLAPFSGEFKRVFHQIDQHLLQPNGVTFETGKFFDDVHVLRIKLLKKMSCFLWCPVTSLDR
jgi:hypothetical protein